MGKFAKGRHAVGICARSGRKMLLKDMVPDGYKPGLMVDPAWREIKHPAERKQVLDDAIALKRPAPDIDDDSAGAGATVAASLFPDGNYFGGDT